MEYDCKSIRYRIRKNLALDKWGISKELVVSGQKGEEEEMMNNSHKACQRVLSIIVQKDWMGKMTPIKSLWTKVQCECLEVQQ
jgi:hypothetical protein